MKIIVTLLTLTLLLSCRNAKFPVGLTVMGKTQTQDGRSVAGFRGYFCADILLVEKGKYRNEKICSERITSDDRGQVMVNLYDHLGGIKWAWQKEAQVVSYQVFLQTEDRKIIGEFPQGKPAIDSILEDNETKVLFVVDLASHDADNFYGVEYVSNYDGDTVTFNIPDVHPLLGKEISIRVDGVQTPEIITSDPCEKELALFAKEEVRLMLEGAERIDLMNVSRGKYFRIVADVIMFYDDETIVSLGEFILENGLGTFYAGDTKPDVDWCNFPN